MKHSKEFIEMTAKDYDVPYEIAKSIINKYPNNFYQELEIYISKRKNK